MIENPTILVPIDVSDPDEPALDLIGAVHPLRIVLLGYHPVPDQTAPQQIRDAHEQDATDALEACARRFADAGVDLESVLVFTRDRVQTTDRVANEYDCDAVLVPGEAATLSRVLVSLKDEQNMFRVLEVIRLVMEANDLEVTLFHADSVERGSARSELYLRGATDWLVEQGLPRESISWEEPTAETQERDLLDLADSHDFVVMGEHEPGIRERVIGDLPNRVHDTTGRPVLVVRKERNR
ncbi:universal stress protein UspA [Halobellus rarus]|uniref:Universal stress protein UspA n=1 Tax=Halobellus rarus TaxID=1126237 RepID=A0ABD6CJT4_9EURY|nr:universal stress protein UspA [Halobellus rarus]